jgi:hypothetical protein
MNMKYLIYILLLLIPVSSIAQYGNKERMYSGYTVVNQGLESSRAQLNRLGDKIYYDLTLKFQNEGDSAKAEFDLGMEIRDSSAMIIKYINEMKVLLIAKCEDKKRSEIEADDTIISLKYLKNFDDYTIPKKILFGDNYYDPKKGEFTAHDLGGLLKDYGKLMDSVWVDEDAKEMAVDHLSLVRSWGWKNDLFKEKPLVAIITSLSKLQLDVKMQEQAAVRHLISR